MVEAARHVTPEAVNAIARSMFAFVASYGAEEETLAAAEADPGAYSSPGPTRPSSITACVPAFVQESGDAIDGGLSAREGADLTTGGHLDGSGIDMDAVVQPGAEDPAEEAPPPPGSIRCAPRAFQLAAYKTQKATRTARETIREVGVSHPPWRRYLKRRACQHSLSPRSSLAPPGTGATPCGRPH